MIAAYCKGVSLRKDFRACCILLAAFMTVGCQSDGDLNQDDVRSKNQIVVGQRDVQAGNRSLGVPTSRSAGKAKATILAGTGQFVASATPRRETVEGVEGDQVTLNLLNASVSQAAKSVLGDILAVNYTVDTKSDGKVTLQTSKPVTKAETLELFQSALRTNGLGITREGSIYRIAPLDQIASIGNLQLSSQPTADISIGSGAKIVQLKFVSASEIRRVLEPMAPKGAILRVDDARNLIVLSGTDAEMSAMLDAISIFDVDVMRGKSFAVIPVKTSQPDIIADELKTIFASEKEGPTKGLIQFVPNSRLGAILIITSQARYLARAEGWIRRLDAQAVDGEKQLHVYPLQNRSAKELAAVLQTMFETEIKGGATTNRNVAPRSQESVLSALPTGSSLAPVTDPNVQGIADRSLASFPRTRFAFDQSTSQPQSSNDASIDISGGAQGPGNRSSVETKLKIVADDANNSLIILADNENYRRVQRIISELDVLPNQVLIEATIAEVTLNDELRFGINFYLQGKRSTYTFTDQVTGAVTSQFPGFSYALKAANVQATLDALNAITSVNVISSPSLTVLDNKTAVLQVGDQVPIATQSAVGVLTPGSPIVNSITYKDTGVILSVTPRINSSGRVLLDIEQEVSSVVNTTSSGIDSPSIRQRRVKTTVVVNNGEALALGGLIQDRSTVTKSQIPLAGDIPIVNNLFRTKTNTIDKTELIILITPKVVRNLTEAADVTEEYRSKLNLYIPRARNSFNRTFGANLKRAIE